MVSPHGLIPVCRGDYIHYFKINPPVFCCPLFSENYPNSQVRINKMVNKHTVDYQPSPSQLISRIHLLIFLWTPKWVTSRESFLSFSLNLYILPWLWKSFKFIVLRLLPNTFVGQNHFYSFPPSKTPPGFCHYPPGRRKLPIPPEQHFLKIFFPEQKGGEKIMELKKIPKLTRVLVTSF